MSKKSFILHLDSLSILDKLNFEQKGILFDAIYKYNLGIEVELDFALDLVFTQFKNQFDRDLEKYKDIVERNKNNGAKGGRPKNPEKPKKTQSVFKEPKKADNDNDSDSDNNINKLILEYNFETLDDKYEKNVKMFHSLFDSQNKTWNDAKFETWIKDYKKLENVLKNNLNAIVAIYTELAMQKMQYYPCKDFHFKTYKSLNGLTKIQKNEVYVYESILEVARENASKNQFWNDEFNKNIEKFKQWN
jgi:hypothetical protein